MSQIRIISQWIDESTRELGVDQNAAITLKMQLIQLTDINKRSGDFTQAFALPRTPDNDLFFGNWGDPSTIGGNWNTRVEAPAWILEDDNIIIQGVLKLESTDPEMKKYYVSVSGNVATIKSILGEGEMSQLDMTPWIYTPAQIFATWTRSLFSGDMVFPIHDFGFGWGLYKKQGTANVLQNFKVAGTPIILDQTIPAFRLTKLLEMIFNEKGITVEGSFFSESEVDEIYVQADNALEVFAIGAGLFTSRIGGRTILDNILRTMNWSAFPVMGDFDNGTDTYTAPLAGSYTFDLQFSPLPGTPTNTLCSAFYKVNGLTVATMNFDWSGTLIDNRTLVLAAGDTVRIDWQTVGAYSVAGNIFAGGPDFWNLTNVVPSGTSVDPSAYWANHRQIDFIRSIFQIFNIIPRFDKSGKLQLDSWNSFMATQGEKKDWSDKVDLPSMGVIPINGELRNPVNIALQKADNVINTAYQDSIGRPYGSYREDQNIPGTLPEAKPIDGFSPAAPQKILGAAAYPEVLICKYYTDEDSLAYKSPGLQLMYYNGARTIPNDIYTTDSAGGATTARTIYPYFSNFRLYLASTWNVLAGTLDLNFTWWTPPSPSIVSVNSNQGLFNRYFREMIRERYDEGSKIIKMNVLLNAADIQNFSFADTIIVTVNGTPVGLRIIEIKDYSPNTQRLTKVKAYITFIE